MQSRSPRFSSLCAITVDYLTDHFLMSKFPKMDIVGLLPSPCWRFGVRVWIRRPGWIIELEYQSTLVLKCLEDLPLISTPHGGGDAG